MTRKNDDTQRTVIIPEGTWLKTREGDTLRCPSEIWTRVDRFSLQFSRFEFTVGEFTYIARTADCRVVEGASARTLGSGRTRVQQVETIASALTAQKRVMVAHTPSAEMWLTLTPEGVDAHWKITHEGTTYTVPAGSYSGVAEWAQAYPELAAGF